MDKKTKFYEKIKEEQTLLRKIMNDFSDFLKKEKQSVLEKKDISYTFINKILVLIEKINHILLDPFM